MPMHSRSTLGEGYPFRQITKRPSVKGGLLICTYTYRFKTRYNRVYLVDVEQYQHRIFIVKFYLKNHQDSKKKFNLTTKQVDKDGKVTYDNDGWRILSTCLQIMLKVREKHPDMSGGFIGANREGESLVSTKRFLVWSQAALTFFNPESYVHYSNPGASTYFIQSKRNTNPDLLVKAQEMFTTLYLNSEGLFSENGASDAG